ncbi:hypothetical protein [Aquimarina sediminis]|uniref:hypothetical protein n=1 Tax=Aquimarina sediminis TaxID=2070536 RepID=UPI000CA05632|nr:hypothetical protein [Aquimarina sediminis]
MTIEESIYKVEREFEKITDHHAKMLVEVNAKEATSLYSIANLYDIEPFFAELQGERLENPTFILSDDDFDPEDDDLYLYTLDLEDKKVFLKQLILGKSLSYDTFFDYKKDVIKSTSIYVNKKERKAIKLCYLFLENRMPDLYIECSQYGVQAKKYRKDKNVLLGYDLFLKDSKQPHCTVDFIYNQKEETLERIEQKQYGDRKNKLVLYQRQDPEKDIDATLQQIEDYLVKETYKQISNLPNLKEQVYCILFEYNMQGVFPPTIAIGLEKERGAEKTLGNYEIWDHYNAPDMYYFSEDETLDVNYYDEKIQREYLFVDQINSRVKSKDFSDWKNKVLETYLRIAKRLMHMDFSGCFEKTNDFLIMVRDFEEYNNEECFTVLKKYKEENKL